MGRPRLHDEVTAGALLAAAEGVVERSGIDALSVRRVADEVGTSTRAVYSLFGSKNGLVVALGAQAFRLLGRAVHELPVTDNPAKDVVEAGVTGFRPFALNHPSLFSIAVQHTAISPATAAEFLAAADDAMQELEARLARLRDAGLLGERTLRQAATHFHALCEGLAALELRGALTRGNEEKTWRDGLSTLVAGLATAPQRSAASPPLRSSRAAVRR